MHTQMQVAWDHHGFEVDYPCYRGHLLVNGYFVELLVDALRQQGVRAPQTQQPLQQHRAVVAGRRKSPPPLPPLYPSEEGIKEAARLFFHLLDRVVVEANLTWRVLCLR